MKKVLFVCTGNTCRSPMAEGMLNKIAADRGLNLKAHSAGLLAVDGARASENAVIAAREFGVDIKEHTARRLRREIVYDSDCIFCMTPRHSAAVAAEYPEMCGQIFLLREDIAIADPYMGDLPVYKQSAREIYDGVMQAADRLEKILRPAADPSKVVKMMRWHTCGVSKIENESFSTPWSEGSFLNEIQNPAACYFVYEEDGSVCGYIGCHIVLDEGYITNIAVDYKKRRRGIADALIFAIIKEARSRGLSFLTLEVRPSNIAAIELYKKTRICAARAPEKLLYQAV